MKRVLKARLRRQVIVTCKTGDAFQGVFFEGDTEAIVLRSAAQIDPHAEAKFIPANGEVVILMADVAYFQFVS